MDRWDILHRIVDEAGSCDWAMEYDTSNPHYICERCPMSKLKKNEHGEYLSCFEALGCENLSIDQHDHRYVTTAKRLLDDKAVEDLLSGRLCDRCTQEDS